MRGTAMRARCGIGARIAPTSVRSADALSSSPQTAVTRRVNRLRNRALRSGFTVCWSTPGVVLLGTSIGYGALANDAGLSATLAVAISALFFALPAQVVLVDEIARGTGLIAIALAVSVTAIRLLPMAVTLVPYFQLKKDPAWLRIYAIHQLAITPWLEAQQRLPRVSPIVRLPLYAGIGTGIMLNTLVGTAVGHWLAGGLPTALSAALLFMTPVYFLLSLIGTAVRLPHVLALGLGAALGPVMFLALADTGLDLLVTGLLGGTAAWLVARQTDRAAR